MSYGNPSFDGDGLVRELTGTHLVYPGHPLVVATLIMQRYPDFTAASKPTKYGWAECVGDQCIPGAGDHVGAALRCLAIGARGGSADEMVEYACRHWTSGRAGGHADNVAAGQNQALAIEQTFRDIACRWF